MGLSLSSIPFERFLQLNLKIKMAQAVVWGKCPFQFPDITTTILNADFYGLRHIVQENALVMSAVH